MNKEHLIAQYFSKLLSLEEQKEFDYLMATDSEFAKEVAFQNNLKIAVKKEEQDTLKKELQEFEAEKSTTSYNYKKWFIAASIIALLALPSLWYFNKAVDAQELYLENFEPYRNVVQPIVRGETPDNLTTKAFTAYETKDYNQALKYFNEMLNEQPNRTIAFYKANVLLELNKPKEAVAIFEANLEPISSIDAKNHWYLALAYLKLEDIENAKHHLQIVETNTLNNFKKEEAKSILKQLE